MDFDVAYLAASFVVSSIGFVLFSYGRKMGRGPQIIVGLVLMVYPYFLSSTAWMLGVGAALLGALWFAIRYAGL